MLPDNRSQHSIHFVISAAGAFLLVLLLSPASFSQSKPPARARADQGRPIEFRTEELKLAAHCIAALKRLENLVLNHESLGDFEANRKLARVSFEQFNKELETVITEVEPLLRRLPASRLRVQIANALYSYRDGAFWWSKSHQPRVINASAYTSNESTLADAAFASSIPYTVAIHWRQAGKYIKRAQGLIN